MSSARLSPDLGEGVFLHDPRITEMVKKLELACERVLSDESIHVMKGDPTTAVCVPERVKEIVQDCLSSFSLDKTLTNSLISDEVIHLKKDLENAHGMLSQLHKERKELGAKYIAVSSKIEKMLEMEQKIVSLSSRIEQLEQEKDVLQKHSRSAEHSHSMKMLSLQQEYDTLVKDLKQRLEDYKTKCVNLEASMAVVDMKHENSLQQLLTQLDDRKFENAALAEKLDQKEFSHREEIKKIIATSEEHQQRVMHLKESNARLHTELEEMKLTNRKLNESVVILTTQLSEAKKTVAAKEQEWKDALEDHFNDNERSAVGYRVEMEGYKMALDEVMLLIRGLSQGTSPYKSSFSPGLSARGSPIAGVDSQGGLSLSPRRPFGITGVPQPTETHGDSKRVKEWFVACVRSTLENLQEKTKDLQKELTAAKESCDEERLAKRNLESEIRSQTAATSMLKRELDANRENLSKVTLSRDNFEKQLMDMRSDKVTLEEKLSQRTARLEALSSHKKEMEGRHLALEELVQNLQLKADQLNLEKEALSSDLHSKMATIKSLETKLSSVSEELQELRQNVMRLNEDKMESQCTITNLELTIQSLELKKDATRRDLQSLQISEAKTIAALDDVQASRNLLEEKVAYLSSKLEEMKGLKQNLAENNTQLAREKLKAVNELIRLRDSLPQLQRKVDQLESEVSRYELEKTDLCSEIRLLKEEVATSTTALENTKQCLTEVSLQRDNLSVTVDKVVQEKRDLVQERGTLMSQIAQTEELLQAARVKSSSLDAANSELKQRIRHLEDRVSQFESSQSSLLEAHELLKQENESLVFEHNLCDQRKKEELGQIVSQKEQELQKALSDAVMKGKLLQEEVENSNRSAERKINKVRLQHQVEIQNIVHEHEEVLGQLKQELQYLQQVKDQKVEKIVVEHTSAVSKLTEESKLLQEQLAKQQKLFNQKCEEADRQQENTHQLMAEQKQQLEVSQCEAERLSHDLQQSEEELKELKMAVLKHDADGKAKDLQLKLRNATQAIDSLEEDRNGVASKMKEVQEKNDSLKRQASEQLKTLETLQEEKMLMAQQLEAVQEERMKQLELEQEEKRKQLEANEREKELLLKQLHAIQEQEQTQLTVIQEEKVLLRKKFEEIQEERDLLLKERSELKAHLLDREGAVGRLQDNVSHLEESLTSAQEERRVSCIRVAELQEALESARSNIAKLRAQTTQLHSSLSTAEGERTSVEAEMIHVLSNLKKTEQEKEELTLSLSTLQGELKAVNQVCDSRVQEIRCLKEEVSSLKLEQGSLLVEMSKLQDEAKLQAQVYAIKLSELQAQVSSLTTERDTLRCQIEKMKGEIEAYQRKLAHMESELAISSGKLTALSSHFDKVNAAKKDMESKYSGLLGFLQDTLSLDRQLDLDVPLQGERQRDRVINSTSVQHLTPSGHCSKQVSPLKHNIIIVRDGGLGTGVTSSQSSPAFSSPFLLNNSSQSTSAIIPVPSSPAEVCLGEERVKESILTFQHQLMSSEKAKKEAVVELRALCEEVEKLQCEKTMLEGNIVELRASMEDAQSQLDRVRGDRDRMEQTASSAQLSLRRAKERIRELEKSMEVLEEQIPDKEKSQRLNESNLKKYKESELSLIGEKNSLSEELQRSQARGVNIQAELDHTRRQLSALESNKMFKESQIATLEQQLSSARGQLEDSIQQANQLREELQAAILTQEKLATTEEHLKEQILLGESQADQAQRRHEEVKVVVEDLHLKLASVRKEKESIEHRLQLVLQSKAEDDKRANVLHRSVQDLQEQLAQRGNSLSSHKLELEQSASQFLFQKQKIELLEAEIAELKKEKGTLLIKIESLELGLSSVEEAKHVSQNLASHLENELSRTRVSYQKLKGENSELRVSMEDSRTRQQQLDTLLSSQKRQRSDLDASLSFSNQQNSDLQRRIWELEGSMDMKDREFKKKLDEFQVEHDGEVSQRLEEVQTLHQLHEREWADREDNYRKAVGQLETKVLLLHNQIRHDKKQNKHLRHVSGFEGEGREMQSLVDPSTQHLTPKEKRMGQTAEKSPQSISCSTSSDIRKKSPRTSTPAKVSLTRSFLPLSPQRYSL